MARNQTADLAAQIGEQRDRLTESVGALTDKIDVSALTDKIDVNALKDKVDVSALTDKIDTDALRTRAGAGVEGLLENATDSEGRPKRGLLIGAVVGLVAVVLLRRVLK